MIDQRSVKNFCFVDQFELIHSVIYLDPDFEILLEPLRNMYPCHLQFQYQYRHCHYLIE